MSVIGAKGTTCVTSIWMKEASFLEFLSYLGRKFIFQKQMKRRLIVKMHTIPSYKESVV